MNDRGDQLTEQIGTQESEKSSSLLNTDNILLFNDKEQHETPIQSHNIETASERPESGQNTQKISNSIQGKDFGIMKGEGQSQSETDKSPPEEMNLKSHGVIENDTLFGGNQNDTNKEQITPEFTPLEEERPEEARSIETEDHMDTSKLELGNMELDIVSVRPDSPESNLPFASELENPEKIGEMVLEEMDQLEDGRLPPDHPLLQGAQEVLKRQLEDEKFALLADLREKRKAVKVNFTSKVLNVEFYCQVSLVCLKYSSQLRARS